MDCVDFCSGSALDHSEDVRLITIGSNPPGTGNANDRNSGPGISGFPYPTDDLMRDRRSAGEPIIRSLL